MGHQSQLIPLQFTPRASVPSWRFYEIDWPIQFCPPQGGTEDFAHMVVYLHERARRDKRIHRMVPKTDVSIQTAPDVHVAYHRDGNLAPDFHHARKQSCIP